MSSVFEVPMTPTSQSFGITLAGKPYNLTVRWNIVSLAWVLDIADGNNVPILSGVPMVTGADLLAQYEYLGFGGKLIVQTDGDIYATPTYKNIGTDSHLYFGVLN